MREEEGKEEREREKRRRKRKKSGWFKETFLAQSDFLSFTRRVGETPPS